MALPVGKNISIYQGDTFELKFTLREKDVDGNPADPVDLTGATVKAQIRSTVDATAVMAEFTGTHNATGGEITLTLSPAQTTALTAGGVWDVQVTFSDNVVKTYLAGTVSLTKEVTRL